MNHEPLKAWRMDYYAVWAALDLNTAKAQYRERYGDDPPAGYGWSVQNIAKIKAGDDVVTVGPKISSIL